MLAWSGGKDSAWALHLLRRQPDVEVAGLFTTTDKATGRIAVHAVRAELLHAQAQATGLPLHSIPLPYPCPNTAYEAAVANFFASHADATHAAFGDLFLEDIRRYRERQFAGSGVELLFPLWGLPTLALAHEMTASGLRAWITCVDSKRAPRDWAGKVFDPQFVAAVPQGIDPCGENGEFHTFVFEGPMLRAPIRATPGPAIENRGMVCVDLVP